MLAQWCTGQHKDLDIHTQVYISKCLTVFYRVQHDFAIKDANGIKAMQPFSCCFPKTWISQYSQHNCHPEN